MNDFKTSDLEGKLVIIQTIWEEKRVSGVLFKYFASNYSIALKNYTILEKRDGKWEEAEKGDVIVLSPKYYQAIMCPKVTKWD